MSNTTLTVTKASQPEVASAPAPAPAKPRGPSRHEQLNKLYALPAPLRTFPLPTFVPHNPISLFHILYVWVRQTISPPASHFDRLYQGWFSPETRSVHVTDLRSIRGLWEQGFYGKGSLSRSEPAWLEGEKKRRGGTARATSEEVTRNRRAERQQIKWERARKEREAIDQKLLEEAEAAVRQNSNFNVGLLGKSTVSLNGEAEERVSEVPAGLEPVSKVLVASPVGPLELLLLPNSDSDNTILTKSSDDESIIECYEENFDAKFIERFYAPPVGPLELLALPNSITAYPPVNLDDSVSEGVAFMNGHAAGSHAESILNNRTKTILPNGLRINGHAKASELDIVGGSETNDETTDDSIQSEESTETNGTPNGSALASGRPSTPRMKRSKSVRFSPTVEQNTFIQSEPPSPERAITRAATVVEAPLIVREQEHLQVTLEEAFFLSYALGALQILDSETKSPMSNEDLFYLFRKTSYFPPRAKPSLSPDDPFMVNYIVYHHFRSLGWVIRSGTKFSCDYMLYVRGPVFTHAEFGVIIIPSYSDPYWKSDVSLQNYVKGKENRTWAWMNCINRVIGQVKKTLILCYVDIPRPSDAAEEQKMGIDSILARYKVREVVMKRFVANRMRK